jgi:hypothetical protein
VTQQNNQLTSQIGVLTSEKESLRRDLELRYQECNSLRLNLQHQQMINSELADELKEYIKPAAAIQQQLPQHHRYSLPESIKESKSDHSGVSDVAAQPHFSNHKRNSKGYGLSCSLNIMQTASYG